MLLHIRLRNWFLIWLDIFYILTVVMMILGCLALHPTRLELIQPRTSPIPYIFFGFAWAQFVLFLIGVISYSSKNNEYYRWLFCLLTLLAVGALIVFVLTMIGMIRDNGTTQQLKDKLYAKTMEFSPSIEAFWDNLQTQWFCCGLNHPYDWRNVFNRSYMRRSCCYRSRPKPVEAILEMPIISAKQSGAFLCPSNEPPFPYRAKSPCLPMILHRAPLNITVMVIYVIFPFLFVYLTLGLFLISLAAQDCRTYGFRPFSSMKMFLYTF